jgi:hypothetical protein
MLAATIQIISGIEQLGPALCVLYNTVLVVVHRAILAARVTDTPWYRIPSLPAK